MDGRRWGTCLLLMVAPWLLAPTAEGQRGRAQDARAEVHFHAAETYFASGDYENASEEFLAAYEMSGRPPLLFNLYLCEERLGHLDKAADYLEQYLSSKAKIADRDSLTARLKKIRERADVEQQALAPAPGTDPTLPSESAGTPAHSATAAAAEGALPVGPIVAFSVAGVGLVLGAVFGAVTIANDADVAHDCKTLTEAQCSAREDDARGIALVADLSLGVSLAAAVTGLVWLLLDGGDDGGDAPEPSVSFAPVFDPRTAGLGLAGRF